MLTYLFALDTLQLRNIGIRLVKSQEQRLEVARLNLRAGEIAITSSAFTSAAKYLKLGVSLLPDGSWDEDYDLTLRLYDAGEIILSFVRFLSYRNAIVNLIGSFHIECYSL